MSHSLAVARVRPQASESVAAVQRHCDRERNLNFKQDSWQTVSVMMPPATLNLKESGQSFHVVATVNVTCMQFESISDASHVSMYVHLLY